MVPFGEVAERADRVLIIASGKSAEGLSLDLVDEARQAGAYILAINSSWNWVPGANGWFTLDPDDRLFLLLDRPGRGTAKYVAVPNDYGRPHARSPYHRNAYLRPGIVYLRRVRGSGLARRRNEITSGNSAFGGLGLAAHMGARKVALIGVDGYQSWGYARGAGVPKKGLRHLPQLFASAAPDLEERGIEVMNGSISSAVTCFPRCFPNGAVHWLLDE